MENVPSNSDMCARPSGMPDRTIDESTPLPLRCRTFRLSEIPSDVTENQLTQHLDGLQVTGFNCVFGNTRVFSLAHHVSRQVATVSFHREPDQFQKCQADKMSYIWFRKHRVEGRAVPINVAIDCDFYRMTPQYKSPEAPRFDIIAVTGLSGHAYGSWKSPDQADVMWLRDMLPLDFPASRILSWGYYSSIKDAKTTTSIADIARNLLHDIQVIQIVKRPLIFFGHSLGRLVIKKAFVDAAKGNTEQENPLIRSRIGILFFGVFPIRALIEKAYNR
ncbi:hypothetical protein FPQ18DRAFT_341810 [Pyronema domesticum]|nr:hypothetical protein FPQ18DRAFT_341810 [Pyronema domesticum]